jgi:hypothetical protein
MRAADDTVCMALAARFDVHRMPDAFGVSHAGVNTQRAMKHDSHDRPIVKMEPEHRLFWKPGIAYQETACVDGARALAPRGYGDCSSHGPQSIIGYFAPLLMVHVLFKAMSEIDKQFIGRTADSWSR